MLVRSFVKLLTNEEKKTKKYIFLDSLYPYCAIKNFYVLGEPEVIIGDETKEFQWKDNELYFPNKNGILTPVEGLILCRVCLPRNVAPKLRGIPFLPQKVREKSIAAECGLCLQVTLNIV